MTRPDGYTIMTDDEIEQMWLRENGARVVPEQQRRPAIIRVALAAMVFVIVFAVVWLGLSTPAALPAVDTGPLRLGSMP